MVGRIIPTPRRHRVDGQGDATENGTARCDAIRDISGFGSGFTLGLRLGVYDLYIFGVSGVHDVLFEEGIHLV